MNDRDWPKVSFETLDWHSSAEVYASRKTRMRHRGPYESAVVPRIAQLEVELEPSVLLELEEASQELVRFDSRHAGSVGPLASLLLRSESAASSQIENLTSSARSVALASLGAGAPPNARLIVGNARAMQAAIRLAGRLDQTAIIEMQSALLRESQPTATGSWREQPVWIGGSGVGPHQANFVPPRAELVPEAMADLVEFMQRDDLPVLAHAALVHAQFETIHPFVDGNGRTGRALLHSMLRSKGLLRNLTIPISAGLLADTASYFASLSAYQKGQPDSIMLMVAQAAFRATTEASWLLSELDSLLAEWREDLQARADALSRKVLEELPRQPVLDAQTVEAHFGASNTAARRALEQLESADIVTEITGRRRSRLWLASRMTDLLDEFAARARRRTYQP